MSGSTTTAEKLVATTMSNIKETMKTLITTTTTEATKAVSAAIAASTTTTTSSISSSSSSSPLSSVTSPAHQHHQDNDGEKILNVADLSTSMQHFGVMDYCVFVLMLIVCAGIGFYFGFIEKKTKKTKNVEHRRGSEALDYLVGGRKMKVFPVSLSLVASFVSGISLLGTSTEIYVYGTQYAFILITLALSGVISWYVFLPVFCNLQLTSTYEYFEMRFGKSIRYFCSILFTVGTILYLPVAMYVPALTFSQVSGLGVHTITPVVCIVCTFYTCVGGLKAVVWTDAVQSFVMYGTILTICIKGTLDLGGLGEVLERNLEGGRLIFPDLSWDPTVRLSMSAILVGSVLHKIQSNDVNQMSLQRFMSLPDTGKVKQCLILFTILLMFLLFCCCYMGLLTYATYYDCDPLSTKLAQADDQLPTILVMRILGSIPGLPGLFVAGVFSAALSSLSTGLNSMACVISEDLVKPFVNLSEKQTGFLLRAIVAFFGLSCIPMVYLVERMGTVLQLATMMGAVTMGPILGFYTTGICMPWIKEKSCLLGGVVSFLTLGWICVNAQMGQMSGEIRHPKLPISVEGCTYPYDNATYWERHNYTPSERNIYHLSFMWYTGMGGIIGCVVANLASLIFGCTKAEDINHDLISPVIRKYFPQVAKETIVMTEVQESKEPLYKFNLDKDVAVRKHSLDKVE
ncbi:sodium-coupled monocarboxylate transporter 1 isoform X3 [Calliphora vicina]|uniref:sodium-coupled monocarboxylate transporter 1 isoform X3 n=1 Tax=Calliphora vicina TaxID=7373 RepID=UPI00325BAE62